VKKWPKRKGVLFLTILALTPLLLLVVAFTWESTGVNPLNLLIPHQQSWGGRSNVSNTSADSRQGDLAVGGTDIHIVWREDTGADANIYFKNKDKEDTSWSSALDLTQTTAGQCLNPAIAVVDNGTSDRIHVVWEDYSEGSYRDILYRKSLDGGSNWDNALDAGPDSITGDTYDAYAPDIAITSTIPHVVWHGAPTGNTKIFYSKDPNGDGINWTNPYTVSTSANVNENPAVALDGSNRIHVTWHDVDEGIKHRRLTGGTWSSVTDLSGGNSTYPDIAAKGNDVYVVWNTLVTGNQYEVWCRRWDGSSWSTASTIATVTTSPISPYPSPRVSVDNSDTVHVAWHGLGTNEREIWHSQSTDKGASWSSPVNISQNSDVPSQLVSIGTDSEDDAHVAWQEQVSDQWDIFHSRTGVAGGIYLPIIMKNY
jgi:hypothetical protein